MTQTKMLLKTKVQSDRYAKDFAEAVGLTCNDQEVTLRFLGDAKWGQKARYIKLHRHLAEELSRLLNYELDD